MSLMPPSCIAQDKFKDDRKLTLDALAARLADSVFYLDSDQNNNPKIQVITSPLTDCDREDVQSVSVEVQKPVSPIRPLGMQLSLGSLFIVVFGSLMGLTYLQISVSRDNGITRGNS